MDMDIECACAGKHSICRQMSTHSRLRRVCVCVYEGQTVPRKWTRKNPANLNKAQEDFEWNNARSVYGLENLARCDSEDRRRIGGRDQFGCDENEK